MITSALLSLLSWIIQAIAFVLPSGNFLPVNFSNVLSDIISYAYGWSWLLPVSTLFAVLSAVIVFLIAEFAWRGGKYLIALLRGN